MIAIILVSQEKWLAHLPSNKVILDSNPYDCNFFVIKFNEFIDNLLWKNSIVLKNTHFCNSDCDSYLVHGKSGNNRPGNHN